MKYLKKFNEDVYYEPRFRDKTPQEIEDEIQPIVEEWIDEQVGLEIGFANVLKGGTEIVCGVDKRKVLKEGAPKNLSKEADEASKEEWRESSEELIDILDREGYGKYTLGSVDEWRFWLWRDEEASGGPISIQVRVPGF